MPLNALDLQRLQDALALAEGSFGLSEPNPRVGCVIGWPDGRVLVKGNTQAPGQAHAEAAALAQARAQGIDLRGATAWVSLEPCSHHGRTPPCCDALVDAGVARVVAALGDPFDQVNGRGFARLRAAGVEVAVADAESAEEAALAQAARDINLGFFSRVQRHRPWVRLKLATSLDGYTALPDGRSQWITGEPARADGQRWRARASAVLSGIGTVLADDPQLNVRAVPTMRQPRRIVLDSRLRLPDGAQLLQKPQGLTMVCAESALEEPQVGARAQTLREVGVEVLPLRAAPAGGVDLPALLGALHAQQVNELHVEAGARLSGALVAAGLVDELLWYQAPRLLGQGRPSLEMPAPAHLADAAGWHVVHMTALGDDLRLRLRSHPAHAWAIRAD
jgi:diaminohydroxyphosphoribosylaminopyrimidine deaminase / 5-amino-6-(5-phosphoribosylamino)uracil reductase